MSYGDRWTRPLSVSLTPPEAEALDALAAAAGLTRTGLVRKWIGDSLAGELGEKTGVKYMISLDGAEAETETASKGQVARKVQEDDPPMAKFFGMSPKSRRKLERARAQAAEREAREAAEVAARRDRAQRTGELFTKGND